MKVSDFNYDLPKELIAQHPMEKRDESRLMVLHRDTKQIEDKTFKDVIDYLEPGDCLVRNNTKVIPARLYGKIVGKTSEKLVEFLLLKQLENDNWEVMVRPGKKLREGVKVDFGDGLLHAEILEVMEDLRANGVTMLTLGQYLQPSRHHLPVARYVPPAEFDEFRDKANAMGFEHAACGPFVRSSYHADLQASGGLVK